MQLILVSSASAREMNLASYLCPRLGALAPLDAESRAMAEARSPVSSAGLWLWRAATSAALADGSQCRTTVDSPKRACPDKRRSRSGGQSGGQPIITIT